MGQFIKLVRKRRKLTQIEVASSLDVSRNTIQNLESGKNFTIDTLFKILKEFDLLDKVYHEILDAKREAKETKSLY
ncbi:MAG: helix-turn-helix transcriptional regulator [Saprospiraceae bacterium]